MTTTLTRRLFGASLAALSAAAMPGLAQAAGQAAKKAGDKPFYKDPTQPIDARVQDLLGRMTLEEKAAQLIGIWLTAALGIWLKFRYPGRYDRLAILLYLAMGWSGALAMGPISEIIPGIPLTLIIIGGCIYSAGDIFHVWERLRFQNAIWHGFVVTAAVVHYSAVFTAIA